MGYRSALFLLALLICGCSAGDAVAATGVRLVSLGNFASPVAIASAPNDDRRLFVAEQQGRIRVIRGGRPLAAPFLDIRARVRAGGEQGLLGLAFAPDYRRSGRFYVYFTRGDGRQTLVEYRRSVTSPERADARSARTLFIHADPEPNHNGGQLQFGPDGLLYIGTGDGGGGGDRHGARGNAQNLGSPLGKLLRIDPRAAAGRPYRIPATNPFVGRSGARAEIYSYGLRNPWRFSFDRATGAIAIADVGQDRYEEITYRRRGGARGANFGWRPFEGNLRLYDEPAPGHVRPQAVFAHSDGWCSITGGYIVRDRGLSELTGRYLFGDFCKPGIWSLRLTSGSAGRAVLLSGSENIARTTTFGQDQRGRLYVASQSGPVYRIVAR